MQTILPFSLLFFFFISSLSNNVVHAAAGDENPFTPKASLIRYWNKEIHGDLLKSSFFLSKVSPLTAVEAAKFAKIASQNALSSQLPSFCSSARLFCFPDVSPSATKYDPDASFAVYLNKNFTNYGTAAGGGTNSFKNYSDGDNLPVDSFRRYSRNAANHDSKFDSYGTEGNVVDQSFNTYGAGAAGGTGEFKKYNEQVNVPNLRFSSYSDNANNRTHQFTSYTEQTNSGSESFTSYGKNGNGVPNGFTGYGQDSNVIGSNFNNYGEIANGGSDNFTSYGFNANVPENTFKSYGDGGNGHVGTFSSYRDQSNVGDDSFQSYAKNSKAEELNFKNYGKSFNEGTDKFTGYGDNAVGQQIRFTAYGVNTTFKEYGKHKEGVAFAQYTKANSVSGKKVSGSLVNKWVEPGKFFRESVLKQGTVMPMPDIRDKMPKRSFLPRTIVSKLPFSTSQVGHLKGIFHAGDNSSMEGLILDALKECERAPSPGETKRCIGSAEDMIDFATSVLGRSVVVRTTANVIGSKTDIMIGQVNGINGGEVTKSVSCHQSLYPYLLYYCHSVPKVRVYEADILDPTSKARINRGVAICHLDTSSWSPTHGAFLALGPGPGRIEVCHWIYENDMTWTIADD